MHTLVLGPDYQPLNYLPLSTVHWQQSLRLFFLNKAKVLEWYDDWAIHSARLTIRVPAVIVTHEGYSKRKRRVAFTRDNLFLRDLYQCGYCGETFRPRLLTVDHVVPRSHGGPHTWTNVITACKPCNHKKGSKLQAPLWTPRKPDYFAIANNVKTAIQDVRHPSWYAYLGVAAPTAINQ